LSFLPTCTCRCTPSARASANVIISVRFI
jgi:hypothetical protein